MINISSKKYKVNYAVDAGVTVMSESFEKFKALKIKTDSIGLESTENLYQYWCYPVNTTPIGLEGCILYCFIDGYDEMVFASNPETCVDTNVYPLSKNFDDFLRLILACGSANPVEQIGWMTKEKFDEHLFNESQSQTEEQRKVLQIIKEEFNLLPMEDPFSYVKGIQKDFDGSKIEYSDEYYEILGIER